MFGNNNYIFWTLLIAAVIVYSVTAVNNNGCGCGCGESDCGCGCGR